MKLLLELLLLQRLMLMLILIAIRKQDKRKSKGLYSTKAQKSLIQTCLKVSSGELKKVSSSSKVLTDDGSFD